MARDHRTVKIVSFIEVWWQSVKARAYACAYAEQKCLYSAHRFLRKEQAHPCLLSRSTGKLMLSEGC
ncbi:hypothetical protein TRIVIDRAFT_34051 [Acetobacter orientalis]|uniref:Uncharacterized protein n=1 Tax=Acetobacter orientalis TaxID=146474 RepID=A0A2Z5ZHH3_9PROT|nr:hypothetical protein TRIVIDRAFT_34051 [Acetobacter orientalis]